MTTLPTTYAASAATLALVAALGAVVAFGTYHSLGGTSIASQEHLDKAFDAEQMRRGARPAAQAAAATPHIVEGDAQQAALAAPAPDRGRR